MDLYKFTIRILTGRILLPCELTDLVNAAQPVGTTFELKLKTSNYVGPLVFHFPKGEKEDIHLLLLFFRSAITDTELGRRTLE